jgi:hypothetical protein
MIVIVIVIVLAIRDLDGDAQTGQRLHIVLVELVNGADITHLHAGDHHRLQQLHLHLGHVFPHFAEKPGEDRIPSGFKVPEGRLLVSQLLDGVGIHDAGVAERLGQVTDLVVGPVQVLGDLQLDAGTVPNKE